MILKILYLVATLSALAKSEFSLGEPSQREGKLFSLFSIVQFRNDPCRSQESSGSNVFRNGTCFTSSECNAKGGSGDGSCAAGFGVCCVFTIKDPTSAEITQNDTYLQNPGFSSNYKETNNVKYTVNKVSPDICFLRLDFETFTIEGPATTDETPSGGKCVDVFQVTASEGSYPEICGDNTGQHIYVNMGNGASSTADLTITPTGDSTERKWDIKVAQIPCGANYAPDDGCLQWHTELSGQITTFNFVEGSNHLATQDYSICIRKSTGFCCLQYTICSEDTTAVSKDFSLDNANSPAKGEVNTACLDDPTSTRRDFIVIPDSGTSCTDSNPTGNRYCGEFFNTMADSEMHIPICACTARFSVGIKTQDAPEDESANVANKGLCLNYQQIACP